MQVVTVGSKYQIVIPKEVRKKIKGLQPGAKVVVQQTEENIISVKPVKRNWADENYGIMRKYWKGKNMIAEVEKMRDEWEEKVRELEQELKKS